MPTISRTDDDRTHATAATREFETHAYPVTPADPSSDMIAVAPSPANAPETQATPPQPRPNPHAEQPDVIEPDAVSAPLSTAFHIPVLTAHQNGSATLLKHDPAPLSSLLHLPVLLPDGPCR